MYAQDATTSDQREINMILKSIVGQLENQEIIKTDLIWELVQADVRPDNGMRSIDLAIQVANVRFNRGK